ncbi:MAG: Ig-like domain-containing protein, partial [Thermoanaerobaculia bacterium]|nr:Ig-like domain-containing protein [Thermoanaerobaculia bacterium]
QTLSASYTLPSGSLQAIRGNFRYNGSASPCSGGNYDDADDLVFAVGGGTSNSAPTVSISNPADGSSFDEGTSVSFSGSASDTEDGDLTSSLAWSSDLDGSIGSGGSFSTSGLSVGTHNITASVTDSGGASASDSITVTINDTSTGNGPQTAVYDSGLGAPACSVAGSSCDSDTLLDGRANLGPEPNQPNTLDTCTDGTSGSYHSDESLDRIVVSSNDGTDMAEGATVTVEATVYAWSDGSSDTLDLYYAADANSPSWTHIASITPSAGGSQTLSASYTLPSGSLQAIRGNFRYNGSASPCSGGSYDDADDLVFAVNSSTGGSSTLDFSSLGMTSYDNQDDTSSGSVAVEDSGATYYLQGNRWRRSSSTFSITTSTVVRFDFWSDSEGEIHGLGFDEDDSLSSNRIFKLYGTQSWGIGSYDDYSSPGSWKSYCIPVGSSFTGSNMYLVLSNDKDSGTANNTSRFRNVEISEDACP